MHSTRADSCGQVGSLLEPDDVFGLLYTANLRGAAYGDSNQ